MKTQCENFMIFLPKIFHVKSNLIECRMVYNLIFDYYEVRLFLISHKYTLFGRKMSKFPHCGKMLKSTDL